MKKIGVIECIMFCCSIGIIIYCLSTYMHVTRYVMPATDDFAISTEIKEGLSKENGYLQVALKLTIEKYMTWQGTFSSTFLSYFSAPFVRMGTYGIRMFCGLTILVFMGGLWVFVHSVMKYLVSVERFTSIIFVFSLIMYLVTNARNPMEVFYWYVGICVYTAPLICTLLGIQCMIKYIYEEKMKSYIGTIIFGVLACGGVLQCSAIICFVYLLVGGWSCLKKHSAQRQIWLAFCVCFFAALVNSLAPGNFVRHNVIDAVGLPIFSAIGYSLKNVLMESRRLLKETDLPYIVVVIFFVGYWVRSHKVVRFRYILLSFLSLFFGLLVSCYPVALGYSSALMEPRGYFILDLFIICGFIFDAWVVGNIMNQWVSKNMYSRWFYNKTFGVAVILSLVILNLINPIKKIERPIVNSIKEDEFGYLERFRNMWGDILTQIENSEEKNVVVQSKRIPSPQTLKNPDLSSDSAYWVNEVVAQYYSKESIVVKWIE